MMKKMTIASFALLILGSSAALAQPYGYGNYGNRYGYHEVRSCQNPDRSYDYEQYRRGHTENIINCIGDPATGQNISQNEYLARYPWSDTRTWVYNPATDLWADHTRDYYGPQYSGNYNRDYSRDNRYRRYRD